MSLAARFPLMIRSARLVLVPTTLELIDAEIEGREAFEACLGIALAEDWPPSDVTDALPYFREQIVKNPAWHGWLGWYAIRIDSPEPMLIGCGGFKGPADASGMVETGYAIVGSQRGRGYGREMVGALIDRAFEDPSVLRVEAETEPHNFASLALLASLGFRPIGPGFEAGYERFGRVRPRTFAD